MTVTDRGYANPDALVSTAWLAEHAGAPDIRLVDASWHMPESGRDAKAEYAARHIPGAVFFDIDEIADTASPLPHMLPSPEKFASRVRKLGLGDGNRIVVYDNGLPSAARVWWMFRVFGHQDVAVLDGGLPKWIAEGRPVTDLPSMPRDRHFTARQDDTRVRDYDKLRRNLETRREQILDVRSAERFKGQAPEPWPGLRAGHIPGSRNLPYRDLLAADGTMLAAPQIKDLMKAAGIDLAKPVVASCGSGVTACVAALALHLVGHRSVAVYDGSWAEWGRRDGAPVAT